MSFTLTPEFQTLPPEVRAVVFGFARGEPAHLIAAMAFIAEVRRSDRAIARDCGTSHPTIAAWRREWTRTFKLARELEREMGFDPGSPGEQVRDPERDEGDVASHSLRSTYNWESFHSLPPEVRAVVFGFARGEPAHLIAAMAFIAEVRRSDRAIARDCGTSHPTIAAWRREWTRTFKLARELEREMGFDARHLRHAPRTAGRAR